MTEPRPVVLLTGASRGIGHSTVKFFHHHGWQILTLARTPFPYQCEDESAQSGHIVGDLSNLEEIEQIAAKVRRKIPDGKLHALVNNAGISPKAADGGRLGLAQTTAEIWQQVMNVNLISISLLTCALIPNLVAAKGAIVNVTSIAGSHVHPFASAAYAASKAALSALTREMAHEFGHAGVRANAVSPGEIRTSILSPGTDQLVEREVPMRRLGEPDEVAKTIFFLCGGDSTFINGTEVHINGGQHV
jgi:NAD(P)-dependent dehydrogenase (short-subunit alcohol dehydrogenase family)